MTGFDDWLSDSDSPQDESFFASRVWAIIQRNAASITLYRGETALAAQTVSVQYDTDDREPRTVKGTVAATRDVVVFGIRNHATLPDTDIHKGDQFSHNGQLFRVKGLVYVKGGIQASAEVSE